MSLRGRIEEVARLSGAVRDRMFALMDAHFMRVTRESFDRDLADKSWSILLEESGTGKLVGFSTLRRLDGEVDGRAYRAIYSGDTIVDRAHWGDTELGRVWIGFLCDVAREQAPVPTYWFLTSMGHRTYRVLPLFFQRYHPSPEGATPAFDRAVLDQLARQRFGDAYDARSGVIRFDPPRECLRPEIAELSGNQERNAAVQFFVERNPGHAKGDELACLARVEPENLTRFARKLLDRTARCARG